MFLIPAAFLLASCAAVLPAAPVAVAPTEVAGSPVPAALPQAGDTSLDPSQAPADAYTLDARHASVVWRIRHMGLSPFVGRFDVARGMLNFDPQTPANATLDISIAANSVSTSVVNREGVHTFDQQIARDVFAAEANPDIRFVSRSISVTGPNAAPPIPSRSKPASKAAASTRCAAATCWPSPAGQ
jgi:polyisoprenoid-binding protein YceI